MCLVLFLFPLIAVFQLLPWWVLRYVGLHQQILEACSQQLLDLARSSMDEGVCVSVCSSSGLRNPLVSDWSRAEPTPSVVQVLDGGRHEPPAAVASTWFHNPQ